MSDERSTEQKVMEAALRLKAAYLSLDDIWEDWQLEGMHSHSLYAALGGAVTAVRGALDRFKKGGYTP